MAIDLAGPVSRAQRVAVLFSCALGIGLIAVLDRYSGRGVPLQGFYLLPLAVAAAFISRWSIFLFAIATAVLSEYFGANAQGPGLPQRMALTTVAFTGVGLFAGELARNRRMAIENQLQTRRRLDSVTETRALLESSPVALLTVDSQGNIGLANASARRLLGCLADSPEGDPIERYIPALARLLHSKQVGSLRQTRIEGSGRRRTGEPFLSQAWVSSYNDASGRCLAVVLSDTTATIRDREESGLKQLLSNSRIVAGAVSHELRNLAAAASVLHLNLGHQAGLKENREYNALETVLESMLRISTEELSDASEEALEGLDVGDLLQELRTIMTPSLKEAGIESVWEIPNSLPSVRANRSGLLQVFLNLTKNSESALQNTQDGLVRVAAYSLDNTVVVRISDNGPGISPAERLFQPFQPGASSTGLGLFVSRAIVRTFGGELHHMQPDGECAFVIELPALAARD